MIDAYDALNVSDATQGYRALALLCGLYCVRLRQNTGRPRNIADGIGYQCEGFRLVKLARDDEIRIVRLVILAVEGGEI